MKMKLFLQTCVEVLRLFKKQQQINDEHQKQILKLELQIKGLVKCLELVQSDQQKVTNLVELLAIKKDIVDRDYH